MQEHGLLHTYYHRLVAELTGDPGGDPLLRAPVGADAAVFEATRRRDVLGRHYA